MRSSIHVRSAGQPDLQKSYNSSDCEFVAANLCTMRQLGGTWLIALVGVLCLCVWSTQAANLRGPIVGTSKWDPRVTPSKPMSRMGAYCILVIVSLAVKRKCRVVQTWQIVAHASVLLALLRFCSLGYRRHVQSHHEGVGASASCRSHVRTPALMK